MPYRENLKGLYVITDDTLTPSNTIFSQVEEALKSGATIVQLRNKKDSDDVVKYMAIQLQTLCRNHNALFVLNDRITLAVEYSFDGLHIGESDYEIFTKIRHNFKGILGVSCYGDIEKAKYFEALGANYIAFGSFFSSPTKPNSSLVPLEILQKAKKKLSIPICAIGGINSENIDEVMEYQPDMVAVISDIWKSVDITSQVTFFTKKFISNI
jgi:thiamine-phosphate pyrophosphorylase